MTELTPDAREFFENLLKQPDVQARPGVKKALEDMLSGRKPKLREKGKPDPSALPDAETIVDMAGEGWLDDDDFPESEDVFDAWVEDPPHGFWDAEKGCVKPKSEWPDDWLSDDDFAELGRTRGG